MEGATEVVLSVRVEASADTTWDILASPERFSAWMGGQASFERESGSAFRVDFPQHGTVVAGKVTAFDAEARRLALTWGSESGPHAETVPAGSTRVEFRVRPEDDGCRVDLRHDGFASAQVAAEYDGGWRYHLGRLDLAANQADLSAGLKRTLAGSRRVAPPAIARARRRSWTTRSAEARSARVLTPSASSAFATSWTAQPRPRARAAATTSVR